MLLWIARLLFHRDAEGFKWPIKRAFVNPCLNWVSIEASRQMEAA